MDKCAKCLCAAGDDAVRLKNGMLICQACYPQSRAAGNRTEAKFGNLSFGGVLSLVVLAGVFVFGYVLLQKQRSPEPVVSGEVADSKEAPNSKEVANSALREWAETQRKRELVAAAEEERRRRERLDREKAAAEQLEKNDAARAQAEAQLEKQEAERRSFAARSVAELDAAVAADLAKIETIERIEEDRWRSDKNELFKSREQVIAGMAARVKKVNSTGVNAPAELPKMAAAPKPPPVNRALVLKDGTVIAVQNFFKADDEYHYRDTDGKSGVIKADQVEKVEQ